MSPGKAHRIISECEETGEPYFVLRAKDKEVLPTLGFYLQLIRRDTTTGFKNEIIKIFNNFVSWRNKHLDRVKVPD